VENLLEEFWKSFVRADGEEVRYRVTEVLQSTRTRFQQVEILRTEAYGLSLFLDDKPQSAEADEFVYHEALVQPALVTVPRPETVFIAGGAEGATLREVLRHDTVKRVVMVDIDGEATDFCRQHLQSWHQGSFDDPRVELRHEDARAYLANSREAFDCVVVDITDPLAGSPAYLLFTEEFYRIIADRLTPEGTVVTQAESFAWNNLDAHLAVAKTLAQVFPHVFTYGVNIPYFADVWGFAVASRQSDPAALSLEEIDRRLAERNVTGLRAYDGEMHRSLVYQPKFYRKMLAEWQRLISDDAPLYVV
jgi:spermidine synthase